MPLPRSRLLTYREASAAAGVTKETIYRHIHLGNLKRHLAFAGSATPRTRIQLGELADLYPAAPGIVDLLSRG